MKSVLIALLGLSCVGCGSTSHEVSIRDRTANLNAVGSFAVAVATHDMRVEVANGEEAANYVGKSTSVTRTVTTDSGFPFAEDVTHAICESLKLKGYQCTDVTTAPNDDPKEVLAGLLDQGGERAVLLVVRRWSSDTKLTTGTTLTFDLALRIYDRTGKVLAESTTAAQQKLSGVSHSPYESIAKEVPPVFQAEIERLFNDPAVVAALKAAQPDPAKGGGEDPFPDD